MADVDGFLMRAIEMIIMIDVGMFLMCAVEKMIIGVTVDGKPMFVDQCFLVGPFVRFLLRTIEELGFAAAVDGYPMRAVHGFPSRSIGRLLTCATDNPPLIIIEGFVVLVMDVICTRGVGGLFRFELLFHPAVLGLAIFLRFNVLPGFRNLLLTSGVLLSFKLL